MSGDEENNILHMALANVINNTKKMPNCHMLHDLIKDVNPLVCCLCLNNITEESPLQLEDEMYCSEYIGTVGEMIDCVLRQEDFVSNYVCSSCIKSTVSAFKFIDMCKQASEKLKKVVDGITNSLDNYNVKKRRAHRLFISTDVNSLQSTIYYDKHKNLPSCKTIASNNQSLMFRFLTICFPESLPTCDRCGKTYTNKNSLARHIKESNCIQMPCDSCGLLIAKKDMIKHKQVCGVDDPTVVGKKKYYPTTKLCPVCGKSVHYNIQMHMLSHDPNAKKKCIKCGKKYLNRGEAKRKHDIGLCHKYRIKYPEDAKRFRCDICKAKYINGKSLKHHMKIHSDNKGDYFECNWCKKRFAYQVTLKAHVVTHTKEKQFECTTCGGKFVSKASLTYHIRTHTGEKPYKCELCVSSFINASRLRDHMRRHHLPPQLECIFCQKKFGGHGCLNKHQLQHLNPKSSLYLGNTKIDILANTDGRVDAFIKKKISYIKRTFTYQNENNNRDSIVDSEDSISDYEN